MRIDRLRIAAAMVLLAAGSAPALAQSVAGAWQTFVRPTRFVDMLAEADTVWCASSDAGLLRYTPSLREFSFELHEPGGLASNLLTALELDSRRRLWIGTVGAGASILSADRETWALVNSFDGLRSDTVTTLTAQGDTMWIGTTAGLALWDGIRIEGTLPDGVNPSPFASDVIRGIAPIGDSLWVATAGGIYVSRLSLGLQTWTTVNGGLPSLTVDHLVSDGGHPFALSAGQVRRWDATSGQWVGTGNIGTVLTLSERRDEVLAASSTGVYRWSGVAWNAIAGAPASSSTSPLVPALDETGRGAVAGLPSSSPDQGGNGIYRQADSGPWTFDLPPGPPGNNCVNLDVHGGAVYVTTNNDGIGRLRNGAWTEWYPTPTPHQGVDGFRQPLFPFAMLSDALGDTWFFCWAPISVSCEPDTGTLEVLDDSGPVDQFRHVLLGPNHLSARRSWARASTLDAFGGHWFGMVSPCSEVADLAPAGFEYYKPDGSYGGNYSIANSPSSGQLLSDLVPALATDRTGQVWGGTGNGLVHFLPTPTNPMPSITRVPNTDALNITALATYADSVWALTGGDLRQYTLAGNSRGSYVVPGTPSPQAVRPMDVGLDGTLWLGTSSGVRAYHPGGSVEDFTTANSPLANDDVHTIRVDRATGVVWMATGGGISRFDPHYVPPQPERSELSFAVYPNPARVTTVGLPIRLSGNASSYHGVIVDLNGRRVRTFSASANGRVVWDCRDEHGDIVRPGIYFVRAESGGLSGVERLVLLH